VTAYHGVGAMVEEVSVLMQHSPRVFAGTLENGSI